MAPNNTQGRDGFSIEKLVAPCGKQQPTVAKNKVEYNDELGSYKAAITPLLMLALSLVCGAYGMKDIPRDKRMEGYFLLDADLIVISICVLYVLASMVWGPRFMRNRKPLPLTNAMLVYNAFQVVLSGYMFLEAGFSGWFFDYNYRCQACDFSMNEKAIRMTKVAHLFYMSKYLDFVDTALFIARGKLNQVTNLHVIHHSCMVISMLYGVRHMPGGHVTFMGFFNGFVHTVMYSYYLLAGLGPKVRPYLWWKKYLTKLQLIQFVTIFLHSAQLLVFPCKEVPLNIVFWTLLYAAIFFGLFINFYVQSYLRRSRQPSSPAQPAEKQLSNSVGSKLEYNPLGTSKTASKLTEMMESKTVQRILSQS